MSLLFGTHLKYSKVCQTYANHHILIAIHMTLKGCIFAKIDFYFTYFVSSKKIKGTFNLFESSYKKDKITRVQEYFEIIEYSIFIFRLLLTNKVI